MEKINAKSKSREFLSILNTHFQGKVNLSRLKLIAMFITALCKVQTVGFEKLANAFDSEAQAASSLRRVQRFIAQYALDSDLVAKLVFSLLPDKENLKLSIDRTNWKFGQTDINIFMLGVTYKGVAFPLLFKMLDKRGNSNSRERIDLVERFIRLFGNCCIDCLMADREFVGDDWIKYLNDNKIRYYIRIRNNFKIFLPHKNKEIKASWLFNSLKKGEFLHYRRIVKMGTQLCYISGCKNDGTDFLIIASFNKPEQAQFSYKERWQIETCFKAMKSSGFDIEKTHLDDIVRIEKLTLLVMIAFVWCYKTGIFIHEHVKKIEIKKHGRKAKSIFKCGLSFIASVLLNSKNQTDIDVFNFLSCT
jgi:transposase